MNKNIKFIATIVTGVIVASNLAVVSVHAATTAENVKSTTMSVSRNIVYGQINADGTPVYSSRSIGSKVLTHLGEGAWVEVDLDASYGDWYSISRDGVHGYVYWRDLTINR